jgi:hypothetical protein
MAYDTTILNGDVGVWWLNNNRTKMLDWIGGTNYNYTMNELYSAMQNLQDEPDTVDDGTAFFADTPVEYTVGKIDQNDNDPFYITFNLMERITGGSLRSTGWTRSEGSNTGIVVVKGTNGTPAMDSGDIGLTVTGSVDGSGTLLEVISDGTNEYLVIRPDDDTAGNSFHGTAGAQVITSTGGGDFDQTVDQTTGEMIWANLYSLGTIDPEVHIYVYRGARLTTDASGRVYSVNSATLDYWGNGHFDVCVPTKDIDTAAWPAIDSGYLRVFARKGGDLFSSFEAATSTTSGGRNPIPLQTSLDLDAGYSSESGRGHGTSVISFTGAVSGGPFENGEVIQQTTGTNAGARGILDLTNSTVTSGGELVYWVIAETDASGNYGGALTAFESGETIQGQTSSASVTTDGAPAADGPADSTWFTNSVAPSIAFANTTADIDNDTNDEFYGITIDCNQNPLTEVYQWMKYVCQYGQGTGGVIETAESGVQGEEYEGGTSYFIYTTISGTIGEGESITQATSGATGVIISHDTVNKIVLVRSTRGAFANTLQVDADDDADYFDATGLTAGNFAFLSAAPLGTFAGGTYFGARGVVLIDYLAADENSFILVDIGGTSRQRPTSIVIEVTNVWGNARTLDDADLVAVYPITGSGGDIDKDPTDAVYAMNCDGGEVPGATTLAVDAIPVWAPSSGGRIVLIDDDDASQEYVIRYSSYDAGTDTYTLANIDIAALDSGTVTTLNETGAFATAKRGDLVYNHDLDEVSYITKITDDDNCTIYPAFSGDPTGDHIEINCIPITVTSSDDAYNCVIHEYPTGSTSSASLIYPGSTFYFRVKVRNSREDDLTNGPIKPYSSDGATSGTDQSIPTVRTIDTIIS